MPDCHSVSSRPGLTRVAAGGLVLLAVLWPVLGGDPARAAAGSDRLLPCQAWTFWQARTYYAPLLAVVPF